jgi:hypothetical protein
VSAWSENLWRQRPQDPNRHFSGGFPWLIVGFGPSMLCPFDTQLGPKAQLRVGTVVIMRSATCTHNCVLALLPLSWARTPGYFYLHFPI